MEKHTRNRRQFDLFPPKILIVDDQTGLTDVLAHCLQKNGYATIAFNEPIAAWEYISTNYKFISLVITDLDMPILSGYQLITLMHENSLQIPIIVASASLQTNDELLCACGTTHRLHKPFTTKELLAAVQSLVGGHDKESKNIPLLVRNSRFVSLPPKGQSQEIG